MDTAKRVRAARGATNMSLSDFADAIGVGRQTLVRIENGSRTPRPHEYAAMARVSGLPQAFFLVEDLHAVLDDAHDPTTGERLAELEAAVGRLHAGLQIVSDQLRRVGPPRVARDPADRAPDLDERVEALERKMDALLHALHARRLGDEMLAIAEDYIPDPTDTPAADDPPGDRTSHPAAGRPERAARAGAQP